jgi:NAD(P)-dependent dehydrogenase (short-subunit alcohol dehydrogenase family)
MTSMLRDKVVLVTGAGSGIGRASAMTCAREGAKVVVTDIDAAAGTDVAREITGGGGMAAFFALDVADPDEAAASVAFAAQAYGRLDGAVNNAASPQAFTRFLEATDEDFSRIMAVNVKGLWLCMRAQIAQMKRQGGGGALVNVSSAAGLRGSARMALYSASKHAVIGLSKSAALEFARSGPRVNVVCPGVVDTPMMQGVAADERAHRAFVAAQPSGRFGAPREIGEAIAWLLSDAASFVTGAAISVDGGLTS